MKTSRLDLYSAVLGSLAGLLALACSNNVTTAATTTSVGPKLEPYEFVANSGEAVEAEFGRFEVPENRSNPEGRKLKLAFVRFPCTSDSCGSPIVYLAGGPGGPGIGTARFDRFPLFMAMREFGDVIAFDQRGTGDSEADLSCGEPYMLPLDRPIDLAEGARVIAGVARECADRLTAEGHDIAAYNTVESADDIDALRRYLGVEKVSLWGISYGSHLGLATLARHGEHIDKAILAGIEPLHHSYKLPSDQERLMQTIAQWIREDPTVGSVVPDLMGSVKGLLAELEREPKTVSLTHPESGQTFPVTFGSTDLQLALTGMLRGPVEFAAMADVISRLEDGDWTLLALAAGRERVGEMWNMMSASMDCASGMSADWGARIEREAKTALLSNAINFPYPEVCEGVPSKDLGDAFREPVKSDVPTLLISGSVDGRTPPSNADEVLPGLSRGAHLVIDGSGHDTYLSSPRVLEAMQAFMRSGKLPFERIEIPRPNFLAPRTIAEVSEATLERYVGNYKISEGQYRRVIRAGDILYTKRGEGGVLPIRPLSESVFFYEADVTWVEFVVDESGTVTGMEMHHDGGEDFEPAVKVE